MIPSEIENSMNTVLDEGESNTVASIHRSHSRDRRKSDSFCTAHIVGIICFVGIYELNINMGGHIFANTSLSSVAASQVQRVGSCRGFIS